MTAFRRSWRPLSFLAATGMAIAGVVGAGSASANNPPAPPDFTYSTAATAVGVQIALKRNPDFSSLPDPFDAETPHSEALLDSFGTSQADAHVMNLNGLGGVPGLICLAAGAAACAQIPVGQLTAGLIPSFPPPDPLDAHASYPAHQSAKAPLVGTKPAQASFDASGFSIGAASSQADAHQYDTSTVANLQNLGITGALDIGSSRTMTTQTATAEGLITTAVASVSNVGLGGKLLNIGSIRSTTTVVSKPGKPATDTTTTVLSDVTVAGLPATIDASGIHIDKNGLPGNVVKAAENLVTKLLGAAGIHVSLADVSRTDDVNGHTVAASGLLLTFDRNVTGTHPITVSPPSGIPCPPQLKALPLDPCSGVSLSLDGSYHGQIALGEVGVVSMAQPGVSSGGLPPGGTTSGGTSPGGGGGLGPGGAIVTPPTGPSVSDGGTGGSPPVIAPPQRAVADQLGGVSHRLLWFFPLFAVGVFSIIGRFRIPARLPGVGSTPGAGSKTA